MAVVAYLILSAVRAWGQDAGATVSASVGATNMASRTELTFTGTAGYRFNRVIGLEIEVTAVPTLHSSFPTIASSPIVIQGTTTLPSPIPSPVIIYAPPTYTSPDGRAVIFTNNVRVDLPTTTAVLTPYFVAGGGVANVRRSADLTFPYPLPLAAAAATSAIPVPLRIIQPVSTSETDLALTLGGGVAVRATSHVSIDGDVRFFRLFGGSDTNAGRFGVGVRYRF
jgi:opacity protein-like surface antigen